MINNFDASKAIYMQQLKDKIIAGLNWTVFEANDVRLWQKIVAYIRSILLNDWRSGILVGAKPEDAYFVKCDRSIILDDELNNGKGHCLVGISLVEPCEFVVLNIPFLTGDMVNTNI